MQMPLLNRSIQYAAWKSSVVQIMVTSKRAGDVVLVMAAMADSMMALLEVAMVAVACTGEYYEVDIIYLSYHRST